MSSTGFTSDIVGHTIFDASGQRIGQIVDLYADSETGAVSFAGVVTLRRGRRRKVFVSLTDASLGPASVTVKCGRELARRAPFVRPGQTLPADAEPRLFAHYDLPHPAEHTTRRWLTPCS